MSSYDKAINISSLRDIKEVVAEDYHNFAIKTNGEVWGWGYSDDFQLTNNVRTKQPTPILIDNSEKIVKISVTSRDSFKYFHSQLID